MSAANPYQPPDFTHATTEAVASQSVQQGPAGLGGWLFLVGIGIVATPLRLGAAILHTFVPIFTNGSWEVLTTPGSERYHWLWAPLLISEVVVNFGFMLAYVVLGFLYFRKSRYFPKTYMVLVIINMCFVVLDAGLGSIVMPYEPLLSPVTLKEVIRSLSGVAIWVPYMLISKRVRNTFVC